MLAQPEPAEELIEVRLLAAVVVHCIMLMKSDLPNRRGRTKNTNESRAASFARYAVLST